MRKPSDSIEDDSPERRRNTFLPVAVIVLTKNEEAEIEACIRSVAPAASEIYIVDSDSTDRTVSIAEKAGARAFRRSFTTFGDQRNWALDNLPIASEWILFLDADERATPDFLESMGRAVRDEDHCIAGYFCCWKMMLDGRWLRRCDNFPKWQMRMLRRGRVRFTDAGPRPKGGSGGR